MRTPKGHSTRWWTGAAAGCAVGAAMLFTGTAETEAASIRELFLQQGAPAQITLSDEDREELVDRNVGDDSLDGRIDVGDSIFGIVAIDQLFVTNGDTEEDDLGVDGNNELTAIFQIRVASKTASGSTNTLTGTPNYDFTFEPDEEFITENELSEGTMVVFYEDDNPDLTNQIDQGTREDQIDRASNGELFWELGFNGETDGNGTVQAAANEYFVATGPDDVSGIEALRPGQAPAQSNFGLNRTSDRGEGGQLPILIGAGGFEFAGNSNLRGALGVGTEFDFTSDASFDFTIIPTPAAAVSGLLLLGLMGATRRGRRQRA